METAPPALVGKVLRWGEIGLRDLPWRASRDPWEILVSETMLQQTQVGRVVDRWPRFLARFPDPTSCADASAADVQREWAGLGYNRRATMLHRAATEIRDVHGGSVPDSLSALLTLPGVGPYTARAVLAFAFEERAAPVDTNIGRVLARLGGATLRAREAQDLADSLVPASEVWRWNQSLMELGAGVCTKRSPGCGSCPLCDDCQWRGQGPDPAIGSAAVPRPQSRFEGSDRQLRGRLVNVLRVSPMASSAVGARIRCNDQARVAGVVDGLVADGVIEVAGAIMRLAGDQ